MRRSRRKMRKTFLLTTDASIRKKRKR
jgi:hypothetical protein